MTYQCGTCAKTGRAISGCSRIDCTRRKRLTANADDLSDIGEGSFIRTSIAYEDSSETESTEATDNFDSHWDM